MAQAQKAIRLGDWLLDRSVVTQTQLDLALREQKRKGWLLGEALAQLGFVTQETLSQFLAQKTQTESVDLAAITIPPEMVKLVPEQLARRLVAVPVSREGDLLTVAISDPLNVTAFDALEQVTRLQVNLVAAPEGDIFLAIERLYASGQSIEDIIDELLKLGSDKLANTTEQDAPMIRLVDRILAQGVTSGSSDIHIHPEEKIVRIRMRRDGVLTSGYLAPKEIQPALIARLKIIGGMDIAESRRPQSGRANISVASREIGLRFSTLPTAYGESIVMRILDRNNIMVTDHKANVTRIGDYLKHIKQTLHLQVDIEAQIYEVVFNDEFHLGIDWQNVTGSLEKWAVSSGGVPAGFPTSRLIVDNPLGGLKPGTPALSLAITTDESRVVLDALKQQGRLEVVSQPRIRTLNNQAALIKVGTEKPFFRKTVFATTGTSSQTTTDVEVQSITIGTVLALTPQISDDGWITMDISPVITRLVDSVAGPDGATAPEVDIKQTSSLVRIRDNTTVIIGGLIQNERHKTERRVPILGDIPILGYPFRGVFENKRRTELVIFITPTIVR